MRSLLAVMNENFDLSSIKEITVEAGRPDTIDTDKLTAMKDFGVNRISINPQTMNNETLKIIGRSHTIEQIESAYNEARRIGFDNINMDLIVGLPGENVSKLSNTLTKLEAMKPESITVHTLALKKGSKLIETKEQYALPGEDEVGEMFRLCRKKTFEMGMIPYYLYRQKNMVGHQENIGYSLPGKECIYNIKMIEEVQSIFALGPGGVTRIFNPENGSIEKIFNDKSIEGYISRIDEMIEKKYKNYNKKTP
jgi:oxygen-independent coproporphyrinogen-3 oxidase